MDGSDGTKVDGLQIEISSSAQNAAAEIAKLTASLKDLLDVKVESGSLDKITQKLGALKTALSGFSATGANLESVSRGLQSLGQVGKISIPKSLTDRLTVLGQTIKELPETDRLVSIAGVLETLSKLEKISIPQTLATRLHDLGKSMEDISDDALARLDKATSALQKVAGVDLTGIGSALRQSSKAPPDRQGAIEQELLRAELQALRTDRAIADVENRLQKLATGDERPEAGWLQDAQEKIAAFREAEEEAVRSASALREALDGIRSGAIDETSEDVRELEKALREAQERAKIAGEAAKNAVMGVKPIGAGTPEIDTGATQQDQSDFVNKTGGGLKRLSDLAKSLLERLKSARDMLAQLGKTAADALGGKALSGLKNLGKYVGSKLTNPIKNAISTFEKFKRAVGRIAFYRLIRSAMRQVTEGFRTGIENLYQYSRLVGTEFAPAMDSLATSALYLKNSLGAMVAPLIQALAPAVDVLVDKFVSLLNVIGKTMAALTGKDVYTQAKKHAVEYAGAADDASKAAKEFQRYLIGIDELTIIDTPNGSGSGSGAGQDYGSMFEEVEVPNEYADWAKEIREAIENGDWYGVGSVLGEKLKGLSEMFSAEEFGANIGEKINMGIDSVGGFLDSGAISKMGETVGGMLNGALGTIHFDQAGRDLAQSIMALPDFLIGALETLDWGKATGAASDFVAGLFTGFSDWMKARDWKKTGDTIWEKLKKAIKGIKFDKLASSLFTLLGTAIRSAAQLLSGFFGSISEDIKTWWDEQIQGDNLAQTGGNLLSAIGKGLGDVAKWGRENIAEPLARSLIGEEAWEKVKQAGGKISGKLSEGFQTATSGLSGFVDAHIVTPLENAKEKMQPVFDFFTERFENLKSIFETVKSAIEDASQKIENSQAAKEAIETITTLIGLLSEKFEKVKSSVSETASAIGEELTHAWSIAQSAWSVASDYFEEIWAAIKRAFSFAESYLGSAFKNAWKTISEAWSVADSFFAGIWSAIRTIFSVVPDVLSGNFGDAWKKIKEFWGDAKRHFSEIWESIKSVFSNTASWFGGVFEEAWKQIKGAFSGFKKFFSNLWDDSTSAFKDIGTEIGEAIGVSAKYAINNALAKIESAVNSGINIINSALGVINKIPGVNIEQIEKISIPRLASGGFPTEGELFLARESGPELVGTIGGRTAVANNDQIVQSVSSGVKDANEDVVNAIYAAAVRIINAISESGGDVYFDSEKVGSKTTRVQDGQTRIYGKSLQKA